MRGELDPFHARVDARNAITGVTAMPRDRRETASLDRRRPRAPRAVATRGHSRSAPGPRRGTTSCLRTRRRRPSPPVDLLRGDVERLAGEHPGGADAVGQPPSINEPPSRPATSRMSTRIPGDVAERAAQRIRRSRPIAPSRTSSCRRAALRVVAKHERLHQHQGLALARGRTAASTRLRLGAEWLLAQHVLMRAQGPAVHSQVHRVGQGDVDGVDLGIGEQRVVAAVRPLDPVLAGVGCARRSRNPGWRRPSPMPVIGPSAALEESCH